MKKWIAFLRAINVGGHTVKMDNLRQIFESLDFANVETFIASGNVVFETKSSDTRSLEMKIESELQQTLGYEVATFLRTDVELAGIAAYQPFKKSELDLAAALNIAFLSGPLDESSVKRLMALQTDIDNFHVHGREIYWLCRKKQSESTFSNAVLERKLGVRSTIRQRSTIQKMAERYSPSGN
jgi:uncharacterized protein (DUF1697 family)